jgi:hypothetical protein
MSTLHDAIEVPSQVASVINLGDERQRREGDGVPPTAGDDERLINEGEAAAELFSRSREQILPMARGLLAAKRKYPVTRKFGDWLRGSPYAKLGEHDRADLINIGEQLDEHEDVIVEFLTTTNLVSPQTIWAAIRKELQPRPKVDPSCYDNNSGDGPADEEPAEPKSNGAKKSNAPPSAVKKSAGPKAEPKLHEIWGSGRRFDLMLLTPSKYDLQRLADDYADPDALRKCLPLAEHVEESATIIVAAHVRDLPVIANVLLPLAGLKGPARVLLVGEPKSPDITDARIVITAKRGDIELTVPDKLDEADVIEIAERLCPDASRTLHLFAATAAKASESRCVVIGDDSWKQEPSVR